MICCEWRRHEGVLNKIAASWLALPQALLLAPGLHHFYKRSPELAHERDVIARKLVDDVSYTA